MRGELKASRGYARSRTMVTAGGHAAHKWPCLLTVLLWFAVYKGVFNAP